MGKEWLRDWPKSSQQDGKRSPKGVKKYNTKHQQKAMKKKNGPGISE